MTLSSIKKPTQQIVEWENCYEKEANTSVSMLFIAISVPKGIIFIKRNMFGD